MDAATLRAAMRYAAELHWPVVPMDGYAPRTANGVRDATTDWSVIQNWWTEWPDANVGIVTGAAGDGGLVVVDVDGEQAEESLHHHFGDRFDSPLTPTVRTGGGAGHRHLYYRYPLTHSIGVGTQVTDGDRLFMVDIRGRGERGVVVAPPSAHESGVAYQWVPGRSPFDGVEPAVFPLDALLRYTVRTR